MTDDDGINGTDNVAVLFPAKPSAAGIPPQPDVVLALEDFLSEAASGKVVGILILGFDELRNVKVSITGKIPFTDGVAALEQMKFGILARDYARGIEAKPNP